MEEPGLNQPDDQPDDQIEDLLRQVHDVYETRRRAVRRLREGAVYLESKSWDCKVAQVIGGLLTVVAGVTIVATGGAAAPAVIAGLEVAGVGIKLGAPMIEAAINSSELEAAQLAVDEFQAAINRVNGTIEKWRKRKEGVHLTYIAAKLAVEFGGDRFAQHILNLVLNQFGQSTTLAANAMAMGGNTTKAITKGTRKAASKKVCKAWSKTMQSAAKAADTAVGKTTAKKVCKSVSKTGKNVGKAASKTGKAAAKNTGKTVSKTAAKAIVAVNTAFLVWDAIDVSFQIRDLVLQKGSEAAKALRDKADEVEASINGTSQPGQRGCH